MSELRLLMAQAPAIHRGKTPPRKHYIPEWAEKRGKSQADIVRALGADKSTVSRWFDGIIPTPKYLEALAGYLSADDVTALFRHPDHDWLYRFLQEHSADEQERAKTLIQTAFPRTAMNAR